MDVKYAIFVKMSDDTWLFVCDRHGEKLVFDDIEKARSHAKNWVLKGKEENVKIVVVE